MSIANFGLIPYGHTILGELKFIEDNEDGCTAYANSLKAENEQSPIAIVKRGS